MPFERILFEENAHRKGEWCSESPKTQVILLENLSDFDHAWLIMWSEEIFGT